MIELADGSLMLNARSYSGTRHRKMAHSFDAGQTWTPLQDDDELIEPQVMATVMRYTDPADGYLHSRILYAGPDSTTSRSRGTVRLSYDDGETWPISKLVYPSGYAYSILTIVDRETIGCFFERDGYQFITLARLRLDWLTDAADGFRLGDLNCDREINAFDIEPFLVALFDPAEYVVEYPDCEILQADLNADGTVNAFDIEPFLDLLFP